MLGCVLHQIHDIHAPVIKLIDNLHATECAHMCNEELECNQWTQSYGSCFLKNHDSFKHYRKFPNKTWVSGSKDCDSKGNHVIKYLYYVAVFIYIYINIYL